MEEFVDRGMDSGYAAEVFSKFFGGEHQVETPEKKLAFAMIESAIAERDTKWIMRADFDYIYSFDNCCSMWGIDASAARKALLFTFETTPKKANKGMVQAELVAIHIGDHQFVHQKHCPQCSSTYYRFYTNKKRSKFAPPRLEEVLVA